MMVTASTASTAERIEALEARVRELERTAILPAEPARPSAAEVSEVAAVKRGLRARYEAGEQLTSDEQRVLWGYVPSRERYAAGQDPTGQAMRALEHQEAQAAAAEAVAV